MCTKLMLAFVICVAAVPAFAQIGLGGKWTTDHPVDPPTITDVQAKQSVQLELIIQDGKASGTLQFGGLGGMYYRFQDGKVIGNKVLFQTDVRPEPTWTVEMLDDRTIMIYREPFAVVSSVDLNQISHPVVYPGVQAARTVERLPPLPIPTAAFTQGGGSGSIIGTVADPSKALIPGVKVTAANDDSGTESATNTNEAGVYRFSGLPPGKYTITATLPGFKIPPGSNIRIEDTEVRQDFTIEVAAQASANPTAASCSTNAARLVKNLEAH
jgi:hypothetical protein